MPVSFNEAKYPEVKQWLLDNPKDESLPPSIKQDLLHFETLTKPEKKELQTALLAVAELPEVLQEFMPNRLGALPGELLDMVSDYLSPQDRRNLSNTGKRMGGFFRPGEVHGKFLECIAFGQQEKAESLLNQVFHEQPERIQEALLHQGKFTDYSGRTFHCSAYEYAYWAKDTHMCRMLEGYMDDKTKVQMLARIDAIEANGLLYKQNDEEHRSTHFDFVPLEDAYQRYLDGYNDWLATGNWDAIDAAWLEVGKAQRNVPAYVAQEYCRPDRSFGPTPEFNEATLPRVLTFHNWTTDQNDSWFSLTASNSGLGFDFALLRGARDRVALSCGGGGGRSPAVDLAAITCLDKVRTADLTLSREHLNPPAMSQSMSV